MTYDEIITKLNEKYKPLKEFESQYPDAVYLHPSDASDPLYNALLKMRIGSAGNFLVAKMVDAFELAADEGLFEDDHEDYEKLMDTEYIILNHTNEQPGTLEDTSDEFDTDMESAYLILIGSK